MYKKFVFSFLALAAAMLLVTGIFNYLADPYSIWKVHRYPGFNMWATRADSVERMGKAISLLSVVPQPEVVFIGASQVDWGIDAENAAELLDRPVYNLGILGMTAYEQRRYVEHVLAVDPSAKEIILAADFTKFVSGSRYKTPFDESLVGVEAQIGKKYVTPGNLEKTLFSFQSLKDSYESVRANRKQSWQAPYYKAGKTLTHEAMMSYFNREHWRFNRSLLLVQREGWLENPQLNEKCFQEFERIAEMCRDHGVGLKIYLPPMHAEAAIAYDDCLYTYGAWLNRLLDIAPVWTFFDIDALSTSPVQEGKFSESTNAYFWDSIHHKSNVGRWIVARLYGREASGMPDNFGLELSEANLGDYLKQLRAKLRAWESMNPEAVENIKYYAGFSDITPSVIAQKTRQVEPVVAMMQAGSVDDVAVFRLRREDYLELKGNGFLPPELLQKSYLKLSNSQGQSWYTLAEPVVSPDTAEFMHKRAYENLGFFVKEPLKDVPADDYDIVWLAVTKDGRICVSESLGKITVVD
ncbi:hypothetical protein [Selenomonas sp. AB3002]|uniref:hypothetical protein n=1 Tax=Selenomonas sp. AB3002 TaxID=1392502 RepID=UPI000496ED43